MAAFKCFFCAKFATCSDHREECGDYVNREKKVKSQVGKIEVKFK